MQNTNQPCGKNYNNSKKSDELLQNTIEEARRQLSQYKQAEELREKKNLKKWILVFAGSTCVYREELDS